MRHDRLRRSAAATTAAIALLGLSACGTSFNAQTNQPYQAGIGADDRSTEIQMLGTLLVENFNGTATLSTSLINTTDEVVNLEGITVTNAEGSELEITEPDSTQLELPVGQSAKLGTEDGKVFFVGDVEPGLYYTVTFRFDGGAEQKLRVPSVARNSVYAEVVSPEFEGLTPSATPTPTQGATPSPAATTPAE